MKKNDLAMVVLATGIIFFLSHCSKPSDLPQSGIPLHKGNSIDNTFVANRNASSGGGVLMQAFYWDVPAGGTWWDVVKAKLPSWDCKYP